MIAASLPGYGSPRIIGEVKGAHVKVAKVKRGLHWHDPEGDDELCYVLAGRHRIELAHEAIELDPGEMWIAPKGLRHNPVQARAGRNHAGRPKDYNPV